MCDIYVGNEKSFSEDFSFQTSSEKDFFLEKSILEDLSPLEQLKSFLAVF